MELITQDTILQSAFANLNFVNKKQARMVCKKWHNLLPVKCLWLRYINDISPDWDEPCEMPINVIFRRKMHKLLINDKIPMLNILHKNSGQVINVLTYRKNNKEYICKTNPMFEAEYSEDCEFLAKNGASIILPRLIPTEKHIEYANIIIDTRSLDEQIHIYNCIFNNRKFINIGYINNIDKLLMLIKPELVIKSLNAKNPISIESVVEYANKSSDNFVNVLVCAYIYLMKLFVGYIIKRGKKAN